MSDTREKVLVVCPGRGCYNRAELGYLGRHHADKPALLDTLDAMRLKNGQPSLSELDQASAFDTSLHNLGDHASSLIYACSYADYLSINPQRYEVVAITGNSLGWYLALACAGALTATAGMTLVNTMGRLMQQYASGGQLVYPVVDDNWHRQADKAALLESLLHDINAEGQASLYHSIVLGGMRVLAGDEAALSRLARSLPKTEHYPMRLANHAAFHTPLMANIAECARNQLPVSLFQPPGKPLIDGRGQSWFPHSSENEQLWDYTLGHQLLACYHFTRAIQVSVREFAPDKIVLTGPGNSLGAATAQALIEIAWRGMRSKQDFLELQQDQPFILSMGIEAQRRLVCA